MRHRSILLLVLFSEVMCGLGWAKIETGPNEQVMVLVFNKAGVKSTVLIEAEHQAVIIFRRANIDITWLNCSSLPDKTNPVCSETQGPNQFVMNLVDRSHQGTSDVFGIAFLGEDGTGNYADIFFDQITRFHQESGAKESNILGAVSAHELGHLLLGLHAHSAWGVMTPHWEQSHLRLIAMGNLSFTPEQASIIRGRIANLRR